MRVRFHRSIHRATRLIPIAPDAISDEFAEVKAVKLLRRGRRLQQVEAVYGQSSGDENSIHTVTPPRSVIPRLRPEFFSSPFFRRFHIQRKHPLLLYLLPPTPISPKGPILEPLEFCNRYYEFCKGNRDVLQAPGQLIALILVVWATSFGVNEFGVEELYDGQLNLRRWRDRVNEMVQEILYLIDIHSVLRKPSWDGVRALLLVLPLTQEVQSPIERAAMYEAAINQVYTLCSLASVSSVESGQGEYVDSLVRARIFWYAYAIDGVTSGLRGGRILLTNEDLAAFERTLPPLGDNSGTSATYAFSYRYATVPIRIASVCRDIHAVLTGPKARQSHELDEDKLHDAWETLDQCWKSFDGLRQYGTDGFVQVEDVERYIDGWQIFIFECHNVIREALKQRLVSRPAPEGSYLPDAHASNRSRQYESIVRLHSEASLKCQTVVRSIVTILRRNLSTHFFQFDAALIRDGCFFAGFLLAGESGSTEDTETCLQALREMRWAFGKSDEREQTVRMIWESRMTQPRSRSFNNSPTDDLLHASLVDHPYIRRPLGRPISVPPLSLSLCTIPAGLASASAPSTACSSSTDWPTSTPPSSSGAGMYEASHRGSPLSPFTHSPHSGFNHLQGKSALVTPSLLLDGPGHSGRPCEPSAMDPVFYFNYGVGEAASAPHVPHQSTILSAPGASDYASSQFFDTSTVVLSNSPMGQQNACTGTVTPSSAVSGDGRQYGDSSFYQ
ncbi:uncharacterized protein FIBRA_08474 [Fibroporia radiculosa]|uniref:Transcription factor domain-containing protein n=1 Tax=Fibroporia radiculosa TaxID=599839 RepID=J4GHH7_9APHY|nr:uncharacterized protein FIBRA_08474 [Fibroporia radiculosa]CCM06228.1 predicted protein [Fibroporia radiculosa]